MQLHTKIRGKTASAIAASLEDAVRAGAISSGDLLPTVRDLAAHLEVSPATVAAAYKVLRLRGLVVGAGRGGTRVTPHRHSPAARRAALPEGLVDLASGNPDPSLLPSIERALRTVRGAPQLYGDGTELAPLTRFLTAEFEADGVPAGALTVVSGALDAVERTLREHLRLGDAVGIEDPSFPGLLDLLAAAGYQRVPIAVDGEGPRPDAMAAALRRTRAVIVTPRAQNPTGAALSGERARELRDLLTTRRDVLLVENDPCGPVAGAAVQTLSTASIAHWVVIRSTSKFLGPDLRFAAVAGDARTIARIEGRQALGPRWVSTVLQQLVLALWSDPAAARVLAQAAAVYEQRRQALAGALAAHGIAAHGDSGFHQWIPVRQEAAVVQALAERGWAVAAGERFRLTTPPAIRVTTSCLSPADALRFAADLAAVDPMGSAREAAC